MQKRTLEGLWSKIMPSTISESSTVPPSLLTTLMSRRSTLHSMYLIRHSGTCQVSAEPHWLFLSDG